MIPAEDVQSNISPLGFPSVFGEGTEHTSLWKAFRAGWGRHGEGLFAVGTSVLAAQSYDEFER